MTLPIWTLPISLWQLKVLPTNPQRTLMAGISLVSTSCNSSVTKSYLLTHHIDSDHINLKDITIYNQDDCIAYKNGTSLMYNQLCNWIEYSYIASYCLGTFFINAENVYCNGGHGFSVGSLGKGASFSTVSDITMKNMTCEGCWGVAQIKVSNG